MLRLASAAVLVPALWLLIKVAPAPAFLAIAALVIALACRECYALLERLALRPFTWLGVGGALALVGTLGGVWPGHDAGLPIAALVIATLICAMRWRPDPGAMLNASWATLFPALVIGLGLAYLPALRRMPGDDGPDLLLLLFLCVMLGDTGAYYAGRAWGRHRMAPVISPKKSWEGALGGLGGSLLAAVTAHVWFYQRLPLVHTVVLGLSLAVVGMLGDLAESMLKRATGVKDSSSLIPGHGGLLDRTDSLLFAGPFLYYYYGAFLQPTP